MAILVIKIFCIDSEWVAIAVVFLFSLAAIFREWIISCFKKPKLNVSFKMEPPYSHKVPFTNTKTGKFVCDSYYFRLKIENSGNYQMENIEVIAVELHKKNREGKYELDKNFLPLNLVWSYFKNLPNPDRWVTMPVINRKSYRFCDLGNIVESKHANLDHFKITSTSNIVFRLDTFIATNTGSHILKPGDYRIKLIVAGKNIKTKEKLFNLNLENIIFDEIGEHDLTQTIKIKQI